MASPLRILILEDSAADAELNLRELRIAGFDPQWQRVETEADYLAALDTPPELILADYSLPHFDGLRALKLLQERRLDIPFIVVSGMLGEETAVEAMKHGATDYVLKDRIARLGAAVERALEEKRLRAEKQKAEAALRANEALLRSITDNTEDIIFVKDLESHTIFKNPAGLRANALPPERVLGHSDAEFNMDPAQAAQFLANDRRVMESGRTETFEEFLTSATGETRVLLTTKTPRFDAEGRVIGLVGVAHDITERKRAEEVLKASLHEKEVLLAEVHHRVKNNLQIVSSLLNLQCRQLTDPAMLDVLSGTRDRVRAMAAVHERLYESGDFARIDLAAHLGSLVRMVMRADAPAGVSVQPVLRLEAVTVDLNTAVPLSLIASELITNALKYAFAGRREGTLTISLRDDGRQHELRIADDGPGFPARIDPATTRTLGLRLVRDLSRQIRGELDLDSTASGTSVVVRWPAQPEATEPPLPLRTTPAKPEEPCRNYAS